MWALSKVFLKIFFRSHRAVFFVVLLPVGIFLILGFLGMEGVLRFQLNIPYEDFLLPGIIAFALLQAGIYTVAYNLIDFRRVRVMKRLAVTPARAESFLFGQILSRFLVALVQVAVLTVVAVLVFDTGLSQNLWLLLPVVFFGNIMFLNFGFLIAAIAKNYEEAAPYTSIVGLVLVGLGDVFFPVANLPEFFQNLADYLPLKPLTDLMRFSIIGTSPLGLVQDAVVLLAWVAGMFIIVRQVFQRRVYR